MAAAALHFRSRVLPSTFVKHDAAFLKCINPTCGHTHGVEEVRVACGVCGALLDVTYDWSRLPVPKSLGYFEHRWATKGTHTAGQIDFSGVWRFRELFPYYRTEADIVTIGEGRTTLQTADLLARHMGVKPATCCCSTRASTPRAASRTTA